MVTGQKENIKNQAAEEKHIAKNVMEELVTEEINKQLKRYPRKVAKFINQVEVFTYALNRLPPLYASSHKGLNRQKIRGKAELQIKITRTVREGIKQVQNDLIRISNPLTTELNSVERELAEAQEALQELSIFFPTKNVSWKNINKIVKPILVRLNEKHKRSLNSRQDELAGWDANVPNR
ncbi:Late competence development protein ComFB [Xenococcus sp. PCC 7305]|uniref:late competence development ComFB family protein n=1 Tax=Xenococcus sp. PCC 7305 TaxID=102125 RepID=UPI0002AB9ACC|nr:late competence development ComFB family protein [Xenococcus sp. PCC 7305]ELS00597.1 Late competence development protein ComFB [Xenococcus sp. PCC 7305]